MVALRIYVLAVVGAAAACPWLLPSGDLAREPASLALLWVAALGTGAARVRVPLLRTHVSAVDPLVFCALALAGPLAACCVGAATVAGTLLRRPKRILHVVFNLGAVVLCAAAASGTFLAMGGRIGERPLVLLGPLAAAAAAYFLVNSVLLTLVLLLDVGGAPGTIWRRAFLWTLPASFAALVLGVALYVFSTAGLLAWTALVGTGCALLVAFYRAHARLLSSAEAS